MKQPHDTRIAWRLLTRNLDKLSVLTADKGYDWELLRQKLRSEGVKPVIKHREFGWHGVANNVLLDDTTYHQRSNIEATFSRFDANTARTCAREPGSVSSANSFSNVPSETPNSRSTALTGEFRHLNKALSVRM